jgi:hypothetical protein
MRLLRRPETATLVSRTGSGAFAMPIITGRHSRGYLPHLKGLKVPRISSLSGWPIHCHTMCSRAGKNCKPVSAAAVGQIRRLTKTSSLPRSTNPSIAAVISGRRNHTIIEFAMRSNSTAVGAISRTIRSRPEDWRWSSVWVDPEISLR